MEKVPRAKASQCAKEKVWCIWRESLQSDEVDGAFLAKSYRRYVVQQENAGTEGRFIATLSTWLKPNRPIAVLSLDTALEERRERKARTERVRAERQAEKKREQEEMRMRELEESWRETDPEAQRLWAMAWDTTGGFKRMGDAMRRYRAYRDERFKPG